jgi:hypothetical protein
MLHLELGTVFPKKKCSRYRKGANDERKTSYESVEEAAFESEGRTPLEEDAEPRHADAVAPAESGQSIRFCWHFLAAGCTINPFSPRDHDCEVLP